MDTQLDGLLTGLTFEEAIRIHNKYGRARAKHIDDSFRCRYCQAYVHSQTALSGVQNRNHCPFCLRSRHVDFQKAGDRLSACKATMQPIGLTMKPGRNKYGSQRIGELMLIHHCMVCGAVSINRIAADDSVDGLLGVLQASSCLDIAMVSLLDAAGIRILLPDDRGLVERQLFGNVRI